MTKQYFQDFWTPDTIQRSFSKTRRSQLLAHTFHELGVSKLVPILELGSGTGRNLEYLYEQGYQHLYGIDFVPMLHISRRYAFWHADLTEWLPSRPFPVVFSMATLQHIQHLEFIVDHLTKFPPNYLITIEDELRSGPVHFPRNYQQVFNHPPFQQRLSKKVGVEHDFPKRGFVLRVFERRREK